MKGGWGGAGVAALGEGCATPARGAAAQTVVVPRGISQPVLTLRRDLRQESIRQAHASWLRLSFVYNHYLFFACILVVALAIVLYLLRLRRIHRRQLRAAQLTLLWLDKVVVPPSQGNGP